MVATPLLGGALKGLPSFTDAGSAVSSAMGEIGNVTFEEINFGKKDSIFSNAILACASIIAIWLIFRR